MTIKLNLNRAVKVKLTEAGIERYKNFYVKYGGKERTVPTDSDGYTQLQLHELMNVFGNMMIPWARPSELPFENNEIIFKRE